MRKLVIKTGKHFLRAMARLQARHSLISNAPILPSNTFPWVPSLCEQTLPMQSELQALLQDTAQHARIPSFHELSPDQARISKGDNWKTYTFYVFGQRIDHNCTQCPATAAWLDQLPGLQNAFFSILAPGFHILPHRGPTKALVRAHLGLIIPEQADRCWLRVDDQRVTWQEGECLLFDDTYEHEVHNETNQQRVVLFLDIERPMNRFGTLLNRLLLGAIRMSAYGRDPIQNLERLRTDVD